MSKAVKPSLEKALARTYWSVDDAMYYLTLTYSERNHFQLIDVDRTTEASDWLPDQLYALWCDTDHIQKPRNSVKNSNQRKDEFEVLYFIQWAKSKGLRIAWLPWAIAEKLLPPDIGQQPTIEPESGEAASLSNLAHKKARTYRLIIAGLLHNAGIDWTSRNANAQVRKLVEQLGEKIGEGAVRSVLNELKEEETVNALLVELRGKVDPP